MLTTILVSLVTLAAAATPPNETVAADEKPLPKSVTDEMPVVAPLDGESDVRVITGSGVTGFSFPQQTLTAQSTARPPIPARLNFRERVVDSNV